MRQAFATAALAATLFAGAAFADQPKCGPGKRCPKEAPCCDLYGNCGIGAYCLGGCDPLFSNTADSCVPSATCKSTTYNFKDLADVASIQTYLGDYSNVNWVASGKPLAYSTGFLLTMAPDTVGTLVGSTHYVWYGKICAKMTTSQGKGVVTAFIMMSDVRDEIDFEWVGKDVQNAQSNFYSQGVTDYTNMKAIPASETESTVHEYCIDWKPDTLSWVIDGKELRTVKRSDTWNNTAKRFDYPQTPARIMLSLWPAGLQSNAPGTVEWAGGYIDWNSPYMQNGYYFAMIEELSVECYDPPKGAVVQGSKSYVYVGEAGTNDTVQIVDKTVVLKSFYASGDNPDLDPYGSNPSQTGSPLPSSSVQVETVPGLTGIGNPAALNQPGDGGNPSNPSGGGGGGGGGGDGGFSQGNTNNNNKNAASELKSKALGGSLFAVWIGVLGLLFL